MREQIALCVGEANGCEYCLSAHTVMGQNAGLNEKEIYLSRRGESVDNKVQVALSFVRKVVEKRGWVSGEDLEAVRDVGYSDEEITEIIANIALHNFTNYFNHIAEIEVDFPLVPKLDSN
jgi:AhpD family alkylhydroperoxidase